MSTEDGYRLTDKAAQLESLLVELHSRNAFNVVYLSALFGNVDSAIEFAENLLKITEIKDTDEDEPGSSPA